MQTATVLTELRHRRFGWWRAILDNPADNEQMKAAIGCKLNTPQGEVEGEYTPWLAQLKEASGLLMKRLWLELFSIVLSPLYLLSVMRQIQH